MHCLDPSVMYISYCHVYASWVTRAKLSPYQNNLANSEAVFCKPNSGVTFSGHDEFSLASRFLFACFLQTWSQLPAFAPTSIQLGFHRLSRVQSHSGIVTVIRIIKPLIKADCSSLFHKQKAPTEALFSTYANGFSTIGSTAAFLCAPRQNSIHPFPNDNTANNTCCILITNVEGQNRVIEAWRA